MDSYTILRGHSCNAIVVSSCSKERQCSILFHWWLLIVIAIYNMEDILKLVSFSFLLIACRIFKEIASSVGNHIELESEVVCHRLAEVLLGGNFIIEVYVVKQKCTTANIVIYSDISLFYYHKFFC